MKQYIYGLVDPITHMIHYIGKTNDLYARWKQHVGGDSGQAKQEWIRRLKMSGVEPLLIVLENTNSESVNERENYWIDLGFSQGWPLTNHRRYTAPMIADEMISDLSMLDEVIDFVATRDYVSVSMLQRAFGIGYQKARRMIMLLIQYEAIDNRYVEGKGFSVIPRDAG